MDKDKLSLLMNENFKVDYLLIRQSLGAYVNLLARWITTSGRSLVSSTSRLSMIFTNSRCCSKTDLDFNTALIILMFTIAFNSLFLNSNPETAAF